MKFKLFINLYLTLLIVTLGSIHFLSEYRGLKYNIKASIFGFSFYPTLWTFLFTILVTIVAVFVTVRLYTILYKRNRKDNL